MKEFEQKLVNMFCQLIDGDTKAEKSGVRDTLVDFGDGVEYLVTYQVSFLAENEIAQARLVARHQPMDEELEWVSRTGDSSLVSIVTVLEEIGKQVEGDYLLRFYEKDEPLICLMVLLEKAQIIIDFKLDDVKSQTLKNNTQ